MSTFEDDRFRWRETYFVLFPARPANAWLIRAGIKKEAM